MDKQAIIEALAKLIDEYGYTDLTRNKYRKLNNKPFATSTIEKYFSSWTNALSTANNYRKGKFSATDKDEISKNFDSETGKLTITTKSLNIQTVDDALQASNIDEKHWIIEKCTTNSWEVTIGGSNTQSGIPETFTNFQVKLILKPRVVDFDNFVEEMKKFVKEYSPDYKPIKYSKPEGNYLLEFSLADLHYGKHAWGKETGTDYDIKIAEHDALKAIDDLIIKSSGYKPDRILLPVGNDLLHIDTPAGTTTLGTKQDIDDRSNKIFNNAWKLIVKVIDKLKTIAPVDVLIIPGNHDQMSVFHIGAVLEAWYNNCGEVNINNNPKLRKYYRYGTNLIGFVHGSTSDPKVASLPLIMAQEAKEDWAETNHREWHLGHFHKKKETVYTAGDSMNGVLIRILQSLSGTDFWHYQHGFVKQRRAAEVFVWDYDEGNIGRFTTYIK